MGRNRESGVVNRRLCGAFQVEGARGAGGHTQSVALNVQTSREPMTQFIDNKNLLPFFFFSFLRGPELLFGTSSNPLPAAPVRQPLAHPPPPRPHHGATFLKNRGH